MSDPNSACYRHSSRESWVLCQRCGRTICGDCQTQAAVGFHCPECVKEARPATSRVVSGRRLARSMRGRTSATIALLVAMVVVYLAQQVFGDIVTYLFAFAPELGFTQPWRFVTSAFVHSGIMHILLNGYSLWVLGTMIERVIGFGRFLVIFLSSTIAGSLAVMVLSPGTLVVGASAGIFGLFSVLFLLNRNFGGSNISLLVIVGINLALGLIVPGISWQAHIGGLIGGFLSGLVALRGRQQ